MTITAYLFSYTLNVLCGGNKSECSRKLGIRRTDFNRMESRFKDGATSVRAIEAIVLLFWREHYSLDQALTSYVNDNPQFLGETGESETPQAAIQIIKEEMAHEWKEASTRMHLFKSAESFMILLEHSFCSKECQALRGCQSECPCRKFADYISWLRNELERSTDKKH